ncbi:hypothetical protein PIB30_006661 [Stylosanthes scabra]|uniref:F-box domain-containing protein n=1 Tax=Stylosanthes scabra TaxID=79078 RepID=A0ABU6R5J1_9FABA|nr:hypothetical protein [Stylosanthes scabra]
MAKPRDYDERNRKPVRVTRNGIKRLLTSEVTPPQSLAVLPEELIAEILVRLPARNLVRLRSQFANEHVRRLIAADPSLSNPRVAYNHQLWVFGRYKRFGDFSVRSLLENPTEPTEILRFEGRLSHYIIGSCNGLLCLLELVGMKSRVMLWNPCTGLASPSLEIQCLPLVYGFGYDHVNDKYKLCQIQYHIQKQKPKPHRYTIRIYTFCPNPSWRTILVQDIPGYRIAGNRRGVFVPGTATLNSIRSHGTNLGCFVLSFDLVKESFKEFSLPRKGLDNETILPELCVLRNCLAVCFKHQESYWSVWLMKEHGVTQSWTKLAVIPCHPRLSGDYLKPLCVWGNNVFVAVASSSKMVVYNLDDGSFEFPRPAFGIGAVSLTFSPPSLTSAETRAVSFSLQVVMEKPSDYDEMNRKPLRVTRNGIKRLLTSAVTPPQPLPVLPDELIAEILLRVPARNLLRLRSVCRSWRTLISSSQFAKEHVRRLIAADPSLSDPRVAYNHPSWIYINKKFGDFSVRSLLENPTEPTEVLRFEGRLSHSIVGSCNGLLCLLEGYCMKSRAILWNPCTGLASSPSLEIPDSKSVCGFGYDHVNDKYKLCKIQYQRQKQKPKPYRYTIKIFTFCPKPSWRTILVQDIQDILSNKTIVGSRRGVFVPGTGTLNWIRSHDTTPDCFIHSLDLVKESFSEFSLPHKDLDHETILQELCVLRNCLTVCFKHQETGWSVWLMKEYGVAQSWTKFAVIPCHPQLSGDHLRPLCVWRNDVLVAVTSSSKIVLYNLDDGNFEFPVIDSSILEPTLDILAESPFHFYHESLVSPLYRRVLRSSSSLMRLIKP